MIRLRYILAPLLAVWLIAPLALGQGAQPGGAPSACWERHMVPEMTPGPPGNYNCPGYSVNGSVSAYGVRNCLNYRTGFRRIDCGWWEVGAPARANEVWYRWEP